MAFLVEDARQYEDTRGFVITGLSDYLPGEQVGSVTAFLDFIEDVARGIDRTKEKRAALRGDHAQIQRRRILQPDPGNAGNHRRLKAAVCITVRSPSG